MRPAAWPLTRIATAVGALGLALGIAAGATALVDTSGSDPSPAGTPTTIAPPTPAAPPLGTTAGTTTADTRPLVPAAAYAVFDVGSDCWMASVHGEETRPVGSLMKLLTARVVMDAGEPERVVTVPELHLSADESVIGLAPGETQRRDVLLRAMLIVSANDAATALAVDVAGSESAFVDLLGLPQVTVERWEAVEAALEVHRKGIEFADALHWALSRGCTGLATFDDRRFARRARRLGLEPPIVLAR